MNELEQHYQMLQARSDEDIEILKNIENILKSKEDQITKVVYKISESNAQAIDLSHQSKNLDKELG